MGERMEFSTDLFGLVAAQRTKSPRIPFRGHRGSVFTAADRTT